MASRIRLRNGDVAWRLMGDEGTLVDLVNGKVHSCNASSSVVVERLRGGATVDELVSLLRERFEVDETSARQGVMATLDYLGAEGVLEDDV